MNKDLYCEKDSLIHPGFCNLGPNYSDYKNIVELLTQPHSNWKFTEENCVIYDVNILPKIIEYVKPYVIEQGKKDAPEIYKQLKTIKKPVQTKKQTNLEVNLLNYFKFLSFRMIGVQIKEILRKNQIKKRGKI